MLRWQVRDAALSFYGVPAADLSEEQIVALQVYSSAQTEINKRRKAEAAAQKARG